VQLNPLDMRFPSRANAGVLNWAGKLYALSEVRAPEQEQWVMFYRPYSIGLRKSSGSCSIGHIL